MKTVMGKVKLQKDSKCKIKVYFLVVCKSIMYI